MGQTMPREQEQQALELDVKDLLKPGLVDTFRNREVGIREAMRFANHEAIESGDEVVISVCQGAGKCKPGSDPMFCEWCERISCLPNGEVRHFKPSVC